APLDSTFRLMGGGPEGAVGATVSWILAILACVGIAFYLFYARRQRHRFNFPQRPMWAEAVLAALGFAAVIGSVLVFNAYPWPIRIAQQYAEANGIAVPEGGLFISHGVA